MYCPKCATANADDAKFCRSCGANLSLVPQALTGQFTRSASRHRRRRDLEQTGPATLADGIMKIFMGFGFLLVSASVFFFAPAGKIWWFWMLLPAFGMLGKGIAEIVSAKYQTTPTQSVSQTAIPPAPRTGELAPANDVLFPPPSITEQTTRQLDPRTDPQNYRESDRH